MGRTVHSGPIGPVSDIAIRTGRKITWDPVKEEILGGPDASRTLSLPRASVVAAVVHKRRSTEASSVAVAPAPTDLASVEPGLVHYRDGAHRRPPPTLRRWSQGLCTTPRENPHPAPGDPSISLRTGSCVGAAEDWPPREPCRNGVPNSRALDFRLWRE